MITGSRGSLPTNLQGLWLDDNDPDVDGDYHTDINLQMNYWLPDRAGLPTASTPSPTTASRQLPGWTAITQRLFNDARPTATATPRQDRRLDRRDLHQHLRRRRLVVAPGRQRLAVQLLFEHYEYTQDPAYLREDLPAAQGRLPVLGGPPDHHDRHRRVGAAARGPDRRQRLVARAGPDRTPRASPTPRNWSGSSSSNYRTATAALGKDAAYASDRRRPAGPACTCPRSAPRPAGWRSG